ncbi:Hypothetical predicted protein [Podarcis lilfordi]|uniref:Uncharacterized protein n=1 Tax=Podarcis lilfordi TaxID=74358 RepID=A0AA35PKN8_9SAUR|nr:Hypothetical predicted protein [Podarcis lilfordi]
MQVALRIYIEGWWTRGLLHYLCEDKNSYSDSSRRVSSLLRQEESRRRSRVPGLKASSPPSGFPTSRRANGRKEATGQPAPGPPREASPGSLSIVPVCHRRKRGVVHHGKRRLEANQRCCG